MKILEYNRHQAFLYPWDRRAPAVAQELAVAIRAVAPGLIVEHIGSTSIPGCSGKGIIDILVIYQDGGLVAARDVLDGMGFQRQGGPDPWPEERPMRVGSLRFDDNLFRVHAHVVQDGSADHMNDVRFRDRMRQDPELVRAYVFEKERILAGAPMDGLEYTHAKGPFIQSLHASWNEPEV